MKIYLRKKKKVRGAGNYYFGNFGEIPLGFSYTTINKNNINDNNDVLHYHKQGYEFYLTLKGSGVIEVEGKEIQLNKKNLVISSRGRNIKLKRY